MRFLAVLIALAGSGACQSPQVVDRLGDVQESRLESVTLTSGNCSSGSSRSVETLIERVIAVRGNGVELEFDLPEQTSAEDRARVTWLTKFGPTAPRQWRHFGRGLCSSLGSSRTAGHGRPCHMRYFGRAAAIVRSRTDRTPAHRYLVDCHRPVPQPWVGDTRGAGQPAPRCVRLPPSGRQAAGSVRPG